jgi:hypothetical protein
MLQVVGYFYRGGKAMNEPSANSFFVVLLFIIRCLVPLAVLFGISYLLRRLGLVAIESPEPKEDKEEQSTDVALSSKLTNATQPKKQLKRTVKVKAAPSRKKTVGKKPDSKVKTGNSRSRSK